MLNFSKFVDAFAEVYGIKKAERKDIIDSATKHLANILKDSENFKTVYNYINEFLDHYDSMKEHHLEEEVHQCMVMGDSFFTACREWDI